MRPFAVLAVVVGLLVAGGNPAGADPPEDPPGPVSRFRDPFATAYEDAADGLVALGGPPPELGCFDLGFEDNLADFQTIELPSGPVKVLIHDVDMPMSLYSASSIEEICDAVFGGVIPEPIATGTVRVVANDNDLFASGSRTNAFGDTATGTLHRADGTACNFSARFKAQITKDGEFRVLTTGITSNC